MAVGRALVRSPGDPLQMYPSLATMYLAMLGFVARPGITVRLTRNCDKGRGFVNGATGIIEEVLNADVFVVKLLSTGALVLVHPMYCAKNGHSFVPCVYGYATTIRRAQGATLFHGCLYFGGSDYPAPRGYGYVGASRFKSRSGVCHCLSGILLSYFTPSVPW